MQKKQKNSRIVQNDLSVNKKERITLLVNQLRGNLYEIVWYVLRILKNFCMICRSIVSFSWKNLESKINYIKNFQVDYYKILNEGESNRRCYEEDGKIVLVTENDAKSNKHKVKYLKGSSILNIPKYKNI